MSHTDLEHGVDAAVEGVHEEHGDEEQLLHAVGVQAHHGLDHEVARHHPHRAGQQPHPQPNLTMEGLGVDQMSVSLAESFKLNINL